MKEALANSSGLGGGTRVGHGAEVFMARADWARLPAGFSWREVAGVACDSRDRVYVFNRGDHPLMIFERDGSFVGSWGEGKFKRAHGITLGPDDSVYCTDDLDHTVQKWTPDGRLLWKWGRSGQPSDTGATSIDYRTIRYAGPPFHYPTNLALNAAGECFVSDGYGNARIHKFSPEGRLLHSWGEPGDKPGQFHVPHGIAVDARGVVYVADRENSRIQIFSSDGVYLDSWTDVVRPCQITFDGQGRAYVAELGYRSGLWPGMQPPSPDAPGGRISIFGAKGQLLARWGGGLKPEAEGDFFAPHDIAVDRQGDVYVAEVAWSAGGNRGHVSPQCHALQKFTRVLSDSPPSSLP